ncbi:cation diffusion facilitator family transporter [Ligilactobacillus sp. WILCCON 0076]|uniref:Cation diffusion facilitator family transporter n=1 Tax=Ligilactobacillus ubinensis TaxID=2876789 RepID=A0A9X2JLR9_9LACO|nr:cation diffusion facilitator family transporter [Ligilactobacillus ubinensis]MCP0887263.1 cation diffusion facilitator family transporter [Ligilactobacillus ubinensis]
MRNINRHIEREYQAWEKLQSKELAKLKAASKHLIVNVGAYLSISILEYFLAHISHSQTLRADAFNNLSGIISTILLMVGLHIAQDIDDDDIVGAPIPKISLRQTGNDQRVQFTRFRYETIFTLVTSIIMVTISLSVIITGIQNLLIPSKRIVPNQFALVGAAIASIVMLGVWYYNKKAGLKLQNAALVASAKDSLSDSLMSIGTFISILGARLFHLTWLDGAASILVGIFILYSGARIFWESSLNLADYFDPNAEEQFRLSLNRLPEIKKVDELKAHYNGNIVTLDVVLVVDANMTVLDSYRLAESIENLMLHRFGIIDTDVSFIPDAETIH